MKNTILYSALVAILALCLINFKYDFISVTIYGKKAAHEVKDGLSFNCDTVFFGSIREGTQGRYKFIYTNMSKGDLTITAAKATCECTVPDWRKDPIHAGQSGEIRIGYNSYGKNGPILVPIVLIVDPAAKPYTLFLKGNVVP